ncbi:MAG TPA: flagellin [Phycisphaerae bacterium]|nr:flagellin [Phycisphaerae bacterium]
MTRINTNIPSLIAQGRMFNNTTDLQTRLERLATGLRINRGKDDPAGLIASEILRSEVSAIGQAIENSQRAINVISTAEGAINETSRLLLDLRGLIVNTANDGALSSEEVQANQLEIDNILASIDRIANTTSFGSKKLLNGSLAYSLSSANAGALTNQISSISVFSARVPEGGSQNVVVQVTASAENGILQVTGTQTSASTIEITGNQGSEILAFASGTSVADIVTSINAVTDSTGVSAAVVGGVVNIASTGFGSEAFVQIKTLSGNFIDGTTYTAGSPEVKDNGEDPTVLVNGQVADANGLRVDIRTASLDGRFYLDSNFAQQTASAASFQVTGGGSLFQLGPDVSPQGQVSIALNSLSSGSLGNSVVGFLDSIRSGGAHEVKGKNFIAAQNILEEAINQVATMRGRLGSLQRNQIETNINSQQIALENVSSSESVIRDADIAQEVSALTRSQILFQSTQQTLQIANSLPQAVLGLLG